METATGDKVSGLRIDSSADTLVPPTPPARAARGGGGERPLRAEPLVVVQPSSAWRAVDLRDLWTFRELLYYLTWRDVKVRYKQTVLGVAWVVMQPLLMTIIFTVFLGMLARVPFEGASYPLFVYAGLLPWTFFSSATLSSGASLVGNTHLITKIYFPRLIIPAAAVAARLLDFGIGFVILAVLMVVYRVGVTPHLLMLPLLTALLALLTFGFGTLVAAMNVRYRDMGVALPVLVQLWMFVSPIIYSSSLVPAGWKRLYALNPLVGIVDNFRASVFGTPFDWYSLAVCAAVTIALLVSSAYLFRRVERTIADVI